MPTYQYIGPPTGSISFPGGITLSPYNPTQQTTLVLEAYDAWDPSLVTRTSDTPRPDVVILSQIITAPTLIIGLEKANKIIITPTGGDTVFRVNDVATEEIRTARQVILTQNHPFIEKINFITVPSNVEVLALRQIYDIQLVT